MKRFFTSLVCLLSPLSLYAATFHALLIGDTQDPELSRYVKKDLKYVQNNLETIAKQCRLPLERTTMHSHKASIKSVAYWLANCRVEQDDVLFFYFSGIGFLEDSQNTKWPTVILDESMERLSFEEIENAFSKRAPRLVVILYDTNSIPVQSEWYFQGSTRVDKGHKPKTDFAKLFLESRGKVLVSASLPDGKKWLDRRGSSFTLDFFEQLHSEASLSNPSWDHAMQRLTNRYLDKRKQSPLIELDLTKD